MSKKIIGIIAVLVVVGLLVGLLLFLQGSPAGTGDSSSTPAAETVYVLNAGEAAPEKITVQSENGELVLNGRPGEGDTAATYTVEGLEKYDYNSTRISSMVRNATTLTAKQVIEEDGDLATFGLAPAAATVEVAYDDGTSATLYIGSKAPGNEGYYAATTGNTVYLITPSSIDAFLYPALELLDKTITTGSAENNSVQDVVLSGTVREKPIVIKAVAADPDADSTTAMVMSTHEILEPFKAELESQRGLEVLQTVFGLSASEVVAAAPTAAQLEEYGLDAPYSVLRATTVDNTTGETGAIGLSASAPDGEGNVYLMREGSDLVYKIAASSLPWLESQVFDIMAKLAILPFIDSVSTITIETPTEQHVYTLTGEGDELVVTTGGKELDTAIFRKFYQELISARYDSVAELQTEEDLEAEAEGDDSLPADDSAVQDDSTPAEETDDGGEADTGPLVPAGSQLVMSITYSYRDGSEPDSVNFYSAPARNVYIVVNDAPVTYLTPLGYVENVLANIPLLAAGESIKPYLF